MAEEPRGAKLGPSFWDELRNRKVTKYVLRDVAEFVKKNQQAAHPKEVEMLEGFSSKFVTGIVLGGMLSAALALQVPAIRRLTMQHRMLAGGWFFSVGMLAGTYVFPPYHSTLIALLNSDSPVGAEARRLYAAQSLGTYQQADTDVASGWA
eukprot:GGOE01040951.1.p1 GENE.GGOE01040951.1~~GGOE01040951.1.p1  ORF type:complete len:166 (-),score=56.51 GGOE01040951.1:222-674(-)